MSLDRSADDRDERRLISPFHLIHPNWDVQGIEITPTNNELNQTESQLRQAVNASLFQRFPHRTARTSSDVA